jgi:hypothetical protein
LCGSPGFVSISEHIWLSGAKSPFWVHCSNPPQSSPQMLNNYVLAWSVCKSCSCSLCITYSFHSTPVERNTVLWFACIRKHFFPVLFWKYTYVISEIGILDTCLESPAMLNTNAQRLGFGVEGLQIVFL